MAPDIILSVALGSVPQDLRSTADAKIPVRPQPSTGKTADTALDNLPDFFAVPPLSSQAGDLTDRLGARARGMPAIPAADGGVIATATTGERARHGMPSPARSRDGPGFAAARAGLFGHRRSRTARTARPRSASVAPDRPAPPPSRSRDDRQGRDAVTGLPPSIRSARSSSDGRFVAGAGPPGLRQDHDQRGAGWLRQPAIRRCLGGGGKPAGARHQLDAAGQVIAVRQAGRPGRAAIAALSP